MLKDFIPTPRAIITIPMTRLMKKTFVDSEKKIENIFSNDSPKRENKLSIFIKGSDETISKEPTIIGRLLFCSTKKNINTIKTKEINKE